MRQAEILHNRITHLEKIVKGLILKNQELYDAVTSVAPHIDAVQARITSKLNDLTTALAQATGNDIPADVATAIAAVQTAVAALDQLVPAPAPEAVPAA